MLDYVILLINFSLGSSLTIKVIVIEQNILRLLRVLLGPTVVSGPIGPPIWNYRARLTKWGPILWTNIFIHPPFSTCTIITALWKTRVDRSVELFPPSRALGLPLRRLPFHLSPRTFCVSSSSPTNGSHWTPNSTRRRKR